MSATYITAALRRRVRLRARDRCEYCLLAQDAASFRHGRIVPLTPIGRATERLRRLNLPERVQVRSLLARANRYP